MSTFDLGTNLKIEWNQFYSSAQVVEGYVSVDLCLVMRCFVFCASFLVHVAPPFSVLHVSDWLTSLLYGMHTCAHADAGCRHTVGTHSLF